MTEGQPPRREGPVPPPSSPQSPGSPQSPPPASPQSGAPQSPPPGAPGAPAAPPYAAGQQPSNGMAVAALVLGIVGVVFVFIFAPIAIILGILGVVFGIIGRNRYKANPAVGRQGLATAGLICGIIAAILGAIFTVIFIIAINEVSQGLEGLEDFTIETSP